MRELLVVEFDRPAERRRLHDLAAARNAAHKKTEKRNPRRSDFEIDFDGVMGEVALSRVTGGRFDYSLGGDAGFDVEANGRRYDVKVRSDLKPGRDDLLVRYDKPLRADVYVLTERTGDRIYFVGWVSREELLAVADVRDLGYGRNYVVARAVLRSPFELLRSASVTAKAS